MTSETHDKVEIVVAVVGEEGFVVRQAQVAQPLAHGRRGADDGGAAVRLVQTCQQHSHSQLGSQLIWSFIHLFSFVLEM